jgi:hypothetical protein
MKKMWHWGLAGLVTGSLGGIVLLAVNLVGPAFGGPSGVRQAPEHAVDVLHTPALLVSPEEATTLSYDVVCTLDGEPPTSSCSPTASLHVRAVGQGAFTEVALQRGENGLFSYTVPQSLKSGAGFEYYVTVDDGRGNVVTVPKAAAEAPERAWTVREWTTVDLGTHGFGSVRSPGAVAAQGGWGAGAGELGLNGGQEQVRIGPSGFDVAPDGSVVVLDQFNDRLAIFRNGRAADRVPITFLGAEGDVAVDNAGTTWVLDDGGAATRTPTVRGYGDRGRPVAAAGLAEGLGDMLRIGPTGPVVHAFPSEMWLPVANGQDGLSVAEQARGARPGRPVSGGREVVVRASREEVRLALVAGTRVLSAWRIASATMLGEVQLAEPSRNGAVAIVRVWTEERAEFRVLQLGQRGLTGSFAVNPGEWAESAALGRFRLEGDTLYHLRSSPAGAEVVTYRMGGTS